MGIHSRELKWVLRIREIERLLSNEDEGGETQKREWGLGRTKNEGGEGFVEEDVINFIWAPHVRVARFSLYSPKLQLRGAPPFIYIYIGPMTFKY